MAATVSGVSFSSATRAVTKTETPRSQNTLNFPWVKCPWKTGFQRRSMHVRMATPTPERIAEKVQESIEKAKEVCEGNTESGECAAAWDEVEEVSAAASHARQRQKEFDPLENYCEDNPETIECKTYDN
ncbi:hypothetical protein MRB53_010590 [Persea americana]|uniref:Uncharacterized protein n=1 Tax=Persea americana TaxID=3435 RepID=A0ACC2LSK7_PERAE|nr:hypothetical protein MRB53_010590 [Persea americana]|eukprot:TRINITY_DN210_c0_g1_i1.p1 TRINITY_DN210_c0_g1~~TRINITY_DN210_c0_g1_i1.p1  ORF type:complete len:129 (+),score=19.35 TRINITY_DN210_c0_g1_i1:815-1201(+)